MSKSNSGHFSGTSGARNFQKLTKTLSKNGAARLFSRPDHVSITSIRNARGTTDTGIIKVIDGRRAEYKTDGKEKAKLIFHRNKRRSKTS